MPQQNENTRGGLLQAKREHELEKSIIAQGEEQSVGIKTETPTLPSQVMAKKRFCTAKAPALQSASDSPCW